MRDNEPIDRIHLLSHAQALFPCALIDLIHTPDEIIHLDVVGHRFTFEIGSDDDAMSSPMELPPSRFR